MQVVIDADGLVRRWRKQSFEVRVEVSKHLCHFAIFAVVCALETV